MGKLLTGPMHAHPRVNDVWCPKCGEEIPAAPVEDALAAIRAKYETPKAA